jgi:Fe-S-cluster containining protein
MQIVPWSQVSSWRCNACGICCRRYDVLLKLPEWLSIVKKYGVKYTASSINSFLLRKRPDGSCTFLVEAPNTAFCSLQRTKPQACKLWPFKILDRPKFGSPSNASYRFGNRRLFIYADAACTGLTFGAPTHDFAYSVIPEFIEIAFGLRQKQFKSTAILQPLY